MEVYNCFAALHDAACMQGCTRGGEKLKRGCVVFLSRGNGESDDGLAHLHHQPKEPKRSSGRQRVVIGQWEGEVSGACAEVVNFE